MNRAALQGGSVYISQCCNCSCGLVDLSMDTLPSNSSLLQLLTREGSRSHRSTRAAVSPSRLPLPLPLPLPMPMKSNLLWATRDQLLIEEPGSQLITTRTTGTSLMQMSAEWFLFLSHSFSSLSLSFFLFLFISLPFISLDPTFDHFYLCPFITKSPCINPRHISAQKVTRSRFH